MGLLEVQPLRKQREEGNKTPLLLNVAPLLDLFYKGVFKIQLG